MGRQHIGGRSPSLRPHWLQDVPPAITKFDLWFPPCTSPKHQSLTSHDTPKDFLLGYTRWAIERVFRRVFQLVNSSLDQRICLGSVTGICRRDGVPTRAGLAWWLSKFAVGVICARGSALQTLVLVDAAVSPKGLPEDQTAASPDVPCAIRANSRCRVSVGCQDQFESALDAAVRGPFHGAWYDLVIRVVLARGIERTRRKQCRQKADAVHWVILFRVIGS